MSPKSAEQFEKIRVDRKEAIMDAALHVFAEETYHKASVSQIAKKAGVSKGLMYNYFDSKEDLLKTLVNIMFEKFMERFPTHEQAMTKVDFHQFIDLSFDIILEDISHAKLFMSMYMQSDVMDLVQTDMMEKVGPMMMMLSNYFEAQGHKDPMLMMRYFSAVIDGVQMHIIMDKDTFPIDEVKGLIKKQFA